MGAKAYKLIESLNIEGCIVEIGSERTEGSTTFLYNFAKSNGLAFYTVDFNKDQYINALKITKGRGAYNMTGEEFLGNVFPLLEEKIGFAYLDNFDLVTNDGRDWTQRKCLYKSYGFDMNNTNSKIAHMTQSLLVEKHSSKNCHIIFDDTWLTNYNEYEGKGAWAIRPMINANFAIKNEIVKCEESEGLKNGYILMSKYE